ncbi:uncharacterized protein F5147DRAFT_647315 [Suillus discolor]|uniref:Uncharacterized protein n=1 Tax=Suillus discolor TaxID=1912936 RepID=A0A9P7K2D6_9AGAM|nr:uncharacterized protein F5147DRAFT_647315 [Suillus discolor]KAG2120937.1 hypothetical protein F5147DRAFT_647315 [Suillus discolor]
MIVFLNEFHKAQLPTGPPRIKHGLPTQKVSEEWLEMCKSNDAEDRRQMDGIPCIMGGLTALCGRLDRRGGNFAWKTLPALLAKHSCVICNYPYNTLMPIPLPPPSWRLIATQQPPVLAVPASQCHTSELILKIVSLTQHSSMTDIRVDQLDELLGPQEN